MSNNSVQNTDDQDITINIPESVKKNLPRDFNLDDIGKIDLSEAEKIANEDILFLNEKDLAEGLEDFDLIPLKETPERPVGSDDSRKPTIGESAPETGIPSLREALRSSGIKLKRDEESVLPLDYVDGAIDSGKAVTKAVEPAARPSRTPPTISEGYIESDDEYVIWDKADRDTTGPKSKITEPNQAAEEKIAETEPEKKEPEAAVATKAPDEDEVTISIENLDEEAPPAQKTAHAELMPLEEEIDVAPTAAKSYPTAATKHFDLERKKRMMPPHEDDAAGAGEVFFIDDKQQGDRNRAIDAIDESGLEKIVSGIVQVDEGPSYVLREADVHEDRERIAVIADEYRPAYEDLFVDLDYKYGDEELDYIHTAIVEEDYGSYIREIDEFFGSSSRAVPAAVELLGLTADEFDTIEDLLFQGEFKNVNLYDRYHLYEFDGAARGGSSQGTKNCRYLLPDQNSLVAVERDSIESDISSNSALIFEEDVEDIKEQLRMRTGKTEVETAEVLERAVRGEIMKEAAAPESVPEKIVKEAATPEPAPEKKIREETTSEPAPEKKAREAARPEPVPEKAHEDAARPRIAATEALFDITDRVVILSDEADVERFIREFPPRKQMNIKMLLKYLDGLFERLPEEIIKKFASSEYFDLYLKVLNEIGV